MIDVNFSKVTGVEEVNVSIKMIISFVGLVTVVISLYLTFARAATKKYGCRHGTDLIESQDLRLQFELVDKVMFSSESSDWITPKKLYNQLNEEYDFQLDPYTTKDNPLGTPYFYTKEDNGLKKSWNYGNVFVNPPYNKEISK